MDGGVQNQVVMPNTTRSDGSFCSNANNLILIPYSITAGSVLTPITVVHGPAWVVASAVCAVWRAVGWLAGGGGLVAAGWLLGEREMF